MRTEPTNGGLCCNLAYSEELLGSEEFLGRIGFSAFLEVIRFVRGQGGRNGIPYSDIEKLRLHKDGYEI